MSEYPTPQKTYILLTRGDAIPTNPEGELVVARPRHLTMTELRYTSFYGSPDIAISLLQFPDIIYCVEEACRRALECREDFPIALQHNNSVCVVMTEDKCRSLSENAVKNGNLEYCKSLYANASK